MTCKYELPSGEDQLVLFLKGLYEKYGYTPYKMSKFEEYDLYVQNKNFLVSDSILTFTDTSGKLMAFKPDVTLSIVRGCKKGETRKVYYNEKVCRPDKNEHRFKEITQTGLESIGNIGAYDICEVISLALQSLAALGKNYLLDVSNLDLLSCSLERATKDADLQEKLIACISQKNPHELSLLCRENGVNENEEKVLKKLCSLEGTPAKALKELARLYDDPLWKKMVSSFGEILANVDGRRVRVDFSVTGDRNYYNGIIFRGFLSGVPDSVLSGGQYDRLMEKMGKDTGALGFALYLEKIERLYGAEDKADMDYVLLYDGTCAVKDVLAEVSILTQRSKKVLATKEIPQKLRAGKIVDLRGKGGKK